VPRFERSVIVASNAIRQGMVSPIGEALAILAASVPILRI